MIKKVSKYLTTKIRSLKVFDWILIIGGLVAVLVFAVLFFRKSTYITATISVGQDSVIYGSLYDTGPKYWFANLFQTGETEKDGLGKIQAEVLKVFSYDINPTRKAVYVDVKLNTVYNRATNTYTYKGVPVLVGSTIKLNLGKVFAQGLVTEVQGFPNQVTKTPIILETQIREENSTFLGTSGTKDYIAEGIQEGEVVKDNNGSTIIKVLHKKVVPAQTRVSTSDGRILSVLDPTRKDVLLTLEVSAEKIGDKYYLLKDIPILVDQILPINTATMSIFPVVTKFLKY